MIYDSLENINRYRGLPRGLDILIDWVGRHDIDDLGIGCNKIEVNRVFTNVMETQTHTREGFQFEAHRKYIDGHVDREDEERLETVLSGWEASRFSKVRTRQSLIVTPDVSNL